MLQGKRPFDEPYLNAYNGRCAVNGLGIRDLLVASHNLPRAFGGVIPWNVAEQHRLDPQYLSHLSGNGIALNALHDKAFDRGLITFDTELRLLCSPSLRDHFADATVGQHFKAYREAAGHSR